MASISITDIIHELFGYAGLFDVYKRQNQGVPLKRKIVYVGARYCRRRQIGDEMDEPTFHQAKDTLGGKSVTTHFSVLIVTYEELWVYTDYFGRIGSMIETVVP